MPVQQLGFFFIEFIAYQTLNVARQIRPSCKTRLQKCLYLLLCFAKKLIFLQLFGNPYLQNALTSNTFIIAGWDVTEREDLWRLWRILSLKLQNGNCWNRNRFLHHIDQGKKYIFPLDSCIFYVLQCKFFLAG